MDTLSIIKTATVSQTLLTTSFTILNGLLGFIFYVFLARTLGVEDFGIFSLAITVMALAADVGNFGVNTGIVNFVSKYVGSDGQKANIYLKIAFIFKITASVIFLIIGYLASPYIADYIFSKPVVVPLRLVFLGLGATWMFSFTTSYYQASQKFLSWGMIQILTNTIRLIGVVTAFSFYGSSVTIALALYIIAPFLGFLFSLINIPLHFLKEDIAKNDVKTFFSFNKWVGISAISGSISSRADTFILGRLATPYGLGLYSAANQLVQVIPQLIGAIGTVVAPKFASYKDNRNMLVYLKKLQIFVIGIALSIVVLIPVYRIFIDYFLGSQYKESFFIFIVLLFSMLVFLISVPVHNAIIYYFSYPKLFSYLSFINLLIVSVLAYYLTFRYGVFATAYAILVTNVVNFAVPAIWMYKKIRNT